MRSKKNATINYCVSEVSVIDYGISAASNLQMVEEAATALSAGEITIIVCMLAYIFGGLIWSLIVLVNMSMDRIYNGYASVPLWKFCIMFLFLPVSLPLSVLTLILWLLKPLWRRLAKPIVLGKKPSTIAT